MPYLVDPLKAARPEKVSRYRDSLRARRSGNQIPVGGEIFFAIPTGPEAHPASRKKEYWVFPQDKTTGAWY